MGRRGPRITLTFSLVRSLFLLDLKSMLRRATYVCNHAKTYQKKLSIHGRVIEVEYAILERSFNLN